MKNIFKKYTPSVVVQPTTVDNTITSVELFQAKNGCRYNSKEEASSANLLTFVQDELISSIYHFSTNDFYNPNTHNPLAYERMSVEKETIKRCINNLTEDEQTFKRFINAVKETKGYNI